MRKKLTILSYAMVLLGALQIEVEQRYFSSPVPQPELNRTAATFGIRGVIVYVTPVVRAIGYTWLGLTVAVFLFSMSPGADKKRAAD